MGKTHSGFGELIYNDSSANPLNTLMVKEIAAVGDSLMMGCGISAKVHHYRGNAHFPGLCQSRQHNRKINNAFEGTN